MIKQIIPLVLTLAVSANADINHSKFGNAGSQEVDAVQEEPIKITPDTPQDWTSRIVSHVKEYAIYYGVPAAVGLGVILLKVGSTGSMSRTDAFRLAMEHFGRTDYNRCGVDMRRAIDALTDQFIEKGPTFATEHLGFSSPVK